MKKILGLIAVALIILPMFSLITFNAAVRADSTDLTLSMPRSTPIIREVDGIPVPMPKQPSQNHWWDIDYWTTTNGSQLPPQMTGRFVAVPNTIGNLAVGDSVLYLPLNVAYGTSSNNSVWFQFDVQFGPNFGWYIWDINGPATNTSYWPYGDYDYTPIGIAYTPGDEYDFSLSTSGTNTITFIITDSTTGASWSKSNWVWTVPSLNMLYDTSMFSPASAVEGYTANSQLTNVPYFQTKVGDGITTFWHRAVSEAPSGISSDVNVGSSGYYYWYMYDGSTNIAITDVTSSKTVVGMGYSANINVTAISQGNTTETFNVTVYANTTIIASENVTLSAGSSATVTFTWNTTGWPIYQNCTISAYAWPVPGETDTTDNTWTDGIITIVIGGDVNADGKVDVKDVYKVALAYGTSLEGPNPPGRTYNPNCDINGDGKIDVKDYYIVCKHYGETAP